MLARTGSIEDRVLKSSWPRGPETLEDLFVWPGFVIEKITQDETRSKRLRSMVCHGIRMSTGYSGIDCPVEVMQKLEQAASMLWEKPVVEPNARIMFTHACDTNPSCQKVLHGGS